LPVEKGDGLLLPYRYPYQRLHLFIVEDIRILRRR
jgi:hypothetical protein